MTVNGKAVFNFAMAVLCAAGAVGYFNDGIKQVRGDVWPDAMRYYSANHKAPSNVTTGGQTSTVDDKAG